MRVADEILKLAGMRSGDFDNEGSFYDAKDRFETFLQTIIARARESYYISAANWVLDRLDNSTTVAPMNQDLAEKLAKASKQYNITTP